MANLLRKNERREIYSSWINLKYNFKKDSFSNLRFLNFSTKVAHKERKNCEKRRGDGYRCRLEIFLTLFRYASKAKLKVPFPLFTAVFHRGSPCLHTIIIYIRVYQLAHHVKKGRAWSLVACILCFLDKNNEEEYHLKKRRYSFRSIVIKRNVIQKQGEILEDKI